MCPCTCLCKGEPLYQSTFVPVVMPPGGHPEGNKKDLFEQSLNLLGLRYGFPPLLARKKRKQPYRSRVGKQACKQASKQASTQQVTRLERHAVFRKSVSLDDVDCFDTLKSHTYQRHKFITLLSQELRGPYKVVLMRTSCQSRFLCDVIERNHTPILSYCHLAAFTVPHKAVSGPFCGPAESGT